MQNYRLPENPTLFGQKFCDIASGKHEPDIPREEAGYVRYPCESSNLNVISCKHPQFLEIANSLGGLGLGGRNIFTRVNPEKIPPIIPEGTLGKYEWLSNEYVAFSLRDALSSHGKRYAGMRHPPKDFRFTNAKIKALGANTKTILSLSGSDSLIETMTSRLGIEGAAQKIAALGFDYIIPPDYSAFLGECVGSHRLNQVRSLVFAEHLIRCGASVIPHIFPSNTINLGAYIEWLRHADISMIAINAQMSKTNEDQFFLTSVVSALLNALPDIHILLQGGSLPALRPLGSDLLRIHVTNRVAIQLAVSSHLHVYDSASDTFKRSYSSESKSLLALMNIDAYYQRWNRYAKVDGIEISKSTTPNPSRVLELAL